MQRISLIQHLYRTFLVSLKQYNGVYIILTSTIFNILLREISNGEKMHCSFTLFFKKGWKFFRLTADIGSSQCKGRKLDKRLLHIASHLFSDYAKEFDFWKELCIRLKKRDGTFTQSLWLNSEFQEDLLVYENTVKFSTPLRNFWESRFRNVNQNQWPVYGSIDKHNECTFLNVLSLLVEFWSNALSIECSCL